LHLNIGISPSMMPRLGLIRDIEMQSKALESYPVSEIPSAALLMLRVEGKSHYDGLSEVVNRLMPALGHYGALLSHHRAAIIVYRNAIEEVMRSIETQRL